MPREPKLGICSVCKTEKPLFDVKNNLCGSCAGKKGGRPPKSMKKEPDKKAAAIEPPSSSSSGTNENTQTNRTIIDPAADYLCDACDAPVRYGQHKCGKCGTWIDWRGSPVQDDPTLIVCPECGAICGHVDQGVEKCPHCNYGG
jgi:hypothetical protein